MKKPASPVQTEKSAKRTPEEKAAHKSAKKASRATTDLTDDRASKKASQKKTLKSAAKQLQKELNNRMSEVVTRIRKETKAKLKEVVKEATRRLDVDTERMFEEALHTIVRHYDSVAGSATTTNGSEGGIGKGKKDQTLHKDGSPRKSHSQRSDDATELTPAAPQPRGRKPIATVTKPATTGAKRGPKPGAKAAAATGAKRGPKPRVQATTQPEADVSSSAASPNTGEVSA
ncbi:hypothetical protein [Hymenobacter negativus]|uniref:Uncharacterized protein n=1 Tax=Hymenobacter negativus TaxID=2795026 RepID=A0ABS3QEJ9_9BACT|nr:hypothetical protein [Hymenobacter negativus]MBO2009664.1 hypothetical protein [Hymenobacter negativus]